MWRAPRSILFFACLSAAACTGVAGTGEGIGKGTGDDDDDDGGGPGGSLGPVKFEKPKSCESAKKTVGGGKWRRLTQRQYRNTVQDLLGIEASTTNFLGDSTTGAFAINTLPPQSQDISSYADAAAAIAQQAVADTKKLTGCDGNDACAAKFIKEFGARAYRRELTVTEVKDLTETYSLGKAEGFAQGLQVVLEVMLQSPNFLYMAEVGEAPSEGLAKLTPYEVATRLSYLLWNAPPDAELAKAARDGELDSGAGVQSQAKRLMKSTRFASTIADFHAQLLHLNKLNDNDAVKKTGETMFDSAMRKAMLEEVNAFVAYAFNEGQANIKTLLTAPYGFPSGPLLDVYKVSSSQLSSGGYDVEDGSRAGYSPCRV